MSDVTPLSADPSNPDEPADKRARVNNVDEAVGRVMGGVLALARAHGLGDIEALGSRALGKQVLTELDRSYANKLRRRARKVIFRTGRRSRRRAEKPSTGVAETYCPPASRRLRATLVSTHASHLILLKLTPGRCCVGLRKDLDPKESSREVGIRGSWCVGCVT